MRKLAPLLMMVALLLACAVVAQDMPQGGGVCCKAPGGETTHYAMSRTCPSGMTQVSLEECGLVSPTPVPTLVPTLVPDPTPVPTPWQPPKDKEVPSWLVWLIGIFANKYTVPFGLGALVVSLVAGYRQLLALFGGKLSPKASVLAALFLSVLTALADAGVDGKIAGQEWVVLLTAVSTFLAAIFGYRLLFSGDARARLGK